MSTGSTPPSPNASIASAWTPPMQRIWSAPEVEIAWSIAGWIPSPRHGGAQATTRGTPPTFGTRTVIKDDASIG